MRKCFELAAVSAVVIALGSYGALAAAPNIVAAIKARQANYKEIGGSFKAINDELKSDSPDMNSVRMAAVDR